MADKMSMSLDEIIVSNPRSQNDMYGNIKQASSYGNQGNNRRQFNSSRVYNKYNRGNVRNYGEGQAGAANQGQKSASLFLSNLHYGVTESDLYKLFSQIGYVKGVHLHFNGNGQSRGTANVIFANESDAMEAVKQYNRVPLDGRPMNIVLISPKQYRPNSNWKSQNGYQNNRRRRNDPADVPTAEQLDAELEKYNDERKVN